jgi:L-seryl-tRNA(Ser) seleniumtransferase
MGVYEELGLTRVINGCATVTRLGGSLMPREVLGAMMEAASAFVDIERLSERVGEEIAAMTDNEAAFVTSSATAGIVLATAAAIAGTDADRRARLPDTSGLPNEVIVQRCGRVSFEYAITQAGGRIVPVGTSTETMPEDISQALSEKTAAVFVAPRGEGPPGLLPIPELVRIAHASGVPVIVDAAAQIPPPSNLWTFTTDWGADCAIFSGGKGLCGPQSTGLILGTRKMIEACAFHASPKPFIGRPMKVGKEELVGLYAAVKWYLSLDHEALIEQYEQTVEFFITELARSRHVVVERDFPSEAGQPMPRAKVTLDEEALGITRDEVLALLRDDNPSVELAASGTNGIYINPQTLKPGEERIVASRLLRILLGQELASLREREGLSS